MPENKGGSLWKALVPWIPYAIVLAIFAYYSFSVDITAGDTYFHPEEWQDQGLFHYNFVYLYQTWSGRWFLNLTLCMIGQILPIWRVINLLATAGILFSLDYLLGFRTVWQRGVLSALVLVYPYETLSSAGWPATASVYWWTISAILLSAVPLRRCVENQKIPWWQWILFLLTTVYACDHEQGGILFLMISVSVLVYQVLRSGKAGIHPFQITQLFVAALVFLSVLLAPGNTLRSQSEMLTWFAEFSDYNVFQKLHLGLVHTFDMFFAMPGLLMLLLSVILLAQSYRTRGKTDAVVILASLPLLLTILYAYLVLLFPKLRLWFFSHHGIKVFDYASMTSWFPVIFLFLWIGAELKVLYDLEGDRKLFLVDTAVFLGGGMTTVGMGFSPTVYSSGSRTDIFLWFVLIYLAGRMLKKFEDIRLMTWISGVFAFVEVGTKM